MKFLTRFLPPFLFTWMLTFTLASVLHSQFVVNELVNVGVVIGAADRFSLTIDDWVGLLPTYGIIIALALLLAFLVTGSLIKWLLKWQTPYNAFGYTMLFTVAGGCAFAVTLLAMQPILNVTLIAGARDAGFYAQILAGLIGGALFARFSLTR